MPALEELTITHYRLLRRLAQGGMSEIYLAEDLYTRYIVAIKLVNIQQREYQERFRREVEAVAALKHDHILPAFDYGVSGSWYYMVMPYITHGTLRDRLAQGLLSLKEAGMLLEQLADALQFAHDHKLLHRDIKPSNILLRDGEHVYLADFGLVKHLEGRTDITQTGCLIGTPEYMAPELAEGETTPSSDIYAVGVVLYQMLTGQVPFKSHTPMGVYWKHQCERPIPPSELNTAIPPAVEQVILHALEKEPQHRFATVRELASAYRQAIEPQIRCLPLSDTPPPDIVLPPRQYTGHARRCLKPPAKTAAIALITLLLLCILPTILGFTLYQDQAQSHRSMQLSNFGTNAFLRGGISSLTTPDVHDMPLPPIQHVSHSTQKPTPTHPPLSAPPKPGSNNGNDHNDGHRDKHKGDHD